MNNIYAILEADKVVNVIVADSLEMAELVTGKTAVQSDIAGIGWTYNPETGAFSFPELPAEEPSE